MSSSVNFHDIAIDYHKRGWNVLPIEGKRPIVSKWSQWQTRKQDLGDINRWEDYWRESTGIAVVCGSVSQNLVVIDLDGQLAVDLFYKQFPQLTRTHTVRTGDRIHLYFYQHHKFITSDKAVHSLKVGDGEIAVRIQNCYVVAPPSKHPKGATYKVETQAKIKRTATLGRVLMWIESQSNKQKTIAKESDKQAKIEAHNATVHQKQADKAGKQWGETALANEYQAVSTAGKGGRNKQLYNSALKLGSIIAGGYLDRSQVESHLVSGAQLSGLPNDEARKTIASGINQGMKSPRHPSNDSTPLPSNRKTDLQRTSEDKKAHDNHPLVMNPDADQLAIYIASQMQSNYAYFNESWHIYHEGFWLKRKNINRGIRDVLRTIRNRGIKNDPATVSKVDFFLRTEMEMMDESCVDNYPDYVNCANGMFNLRTMKLEPSSPQFLITGKTSWSYDPKASCPTFLKWLTSMLTYPDGTPDPLMLDFVQEAFGYSLTTDTRYRMSFWLKGPKHSGKSTLLEVLSELMDIYHGILDLNQLDKNRFLLALTYRKRIVTCAEVEKGLKINDGQYNQLVDNASKVIADVKNKEPITFKPTAKVWWAMNNFPRITDNTGAVHSRVTVIPYHRSVSIEERDLDLLDKIRLELPGIFNWTIEGLVRLNYNKRFTEAPQSEELKQELEVKDSIYRQFLLDDLWCTSGGDETTRRVNDAFVLWCKRHDIKTYAKTDRGRYQNWQDAGLVGEKLGSHRKFIGVHLTDYALRQVG